MVSSLLSPRSRSDSSAKSISMMPFFFTMPMSRMMPMMPMTSSGEQHQGQQGAKSGRGQRRDDRERMDRALVEDAKNETATKAATIRMGVLLSELWKAWALPWKLVVIEGGRWRSAAALRIAVTAFPIVLLAARLKLKVTEGNSPCLFTPPEPIYAILPPSRLHTPT